MTTTARDEPEMEVKVEELPMTFLVKYMGSRVAHGIWGIKHTRGPVDELVIMSKNLPPSRPLPHCKLTVSTEGVELSLCDDSKQPGCIWRYPVETISYGVMDIVYTRIFAMIVVKDTERPRPFEAHAFICESRSMARKLTFSLAAAFRDYSRRPQANTGSETGTIDRIKNARRKFAIDLRTPEQIRADEPSETEA